MMGTNGDAFLDPGSGWPAPAKRPSMEEYAELARLKFMHVKLEATVKSKVEVLSFIMTQLKREHCCIEQLLTQNTACRSELQLPMADSSNIICEALQGEMSDMIEVIAAMFREPCTQDLHGGPGFHIPTASWNSGTASSVVSTTSIIEQSMSLLQSEAHPVEASYQGFPPHDHFSQAQNQRSTGVPQITSSARVDFDEANNLYQSFPRAVEPEHACQSTAHRGTIPYGGHPCHLQQNMWLQEAEGHVQQTLAGGIGAPTLDHTLAPAQTSDPIPLRRADVPRPLNQGTLTLMIRNIPARYKQERLLQEWPPDESFNMLYMPLTKRGMSRGYAFLNFVSPEHALAFQRQWHGSRLSDHGNNKHLDVSAARVQGLVETLRDMPAGEDWRTWSQNASSIPLIFNGSQPVNIETVISQLGLDTRWQQPH